VRGKNQDPNKSWEANKQSKAKENKGEQSRDIIPKSLIMEASKPLVEVDD